MGTSVVRKFVPDKTGSVQEISDWLGCSSSVSFLLDAVGNHPTDPNSYYAHQCTYVEKYKVKWLENDLMSKILVRFHKKVEKFGIHEYQKIWYAKS